MALDWGALPSPSVVMSEVAIMAPAPTEKSMTSRSATTIRGAAGCLLRTMALPESQTRMGYNPDLSGITRCIRSGPLDVRADQGAAQPAVLAPYLGNHLAIADRADGVLGELL